MKSIIIVLFCLFISCKETKDKKQQEFKSHNIKELQGVWESFSYYLEHESEFKDFNEHKIFKIIKGREALEITLLHHNIDSILLNTYDIGFINTKEQNIELTKIKDLKDSGNLLVRFNKKTPKKIEISTTFNQYFEITEILDDGFKDDYSFKTLTTLPIALFSKLKEQSNIKGIDYIKGYNLDIFSLKGKIKRDKTYFYNEKNIKSKRKAFLVKGDIVYVEEKDKEWTKVYFNGKIISGGYIKSADLDIIPIQND